MENIVIKESIKIENYIYEIRGKQVMLDSDLAYFYKCKNGTKEINQAVKNNLTKFPERFAFRITEYEYKNLKSKFLTSSLNNNYGGSRKGHTVFTEQGVAMLATILKSSKATETSIAIMDAFVSMRHYLGNNELRISSVEQKVIDHDNRLLLIEDTFNSFNEDLNKIYFEGQRYDAYSFMIDIFNKSKSEIIIIDNYIDKNILDILSKTKKSVTIITNKYNNTDYEKYKSQYNNVTLIINNNIHDRFIIIDRKTLYHCGSSFKDLGNKLFVISKIENKVLLNDLLKLIK